MNKAIHTVCLRQTDGQTFYRLMALINAGKQTNKQTAECDNLATHNAWPAAYRDPTVTPHWMRSDPVCKHSPRCPRSCYNTADRFWPLAATIGEPPQRGEPDGFCISSFISFQFLSLLVSVSEEPCSFFPLSVPGSHIVPYSPGLVGVLLASAA